MNAQSLSCKRPRDLVSEATVPISSQYQHSYHGGICLQFDEMCIRRMKDERMMRDGRKGKIPRR